MTLALHSAGLRSEHMLLVSERNTLCFMNSSCSWQGAMLVVSSGVSAAVTQQAGEQSSASRHALEVI